MDSYWHNMSLPVWYFTSVIVIIITKQHQKGKVFFSIWLVLVIVAFLVWMRILIQHRVGVWYDIKSLKGGEGADRWRIIILKRGHRASSTNASTPVTRISNRLLCYIIGSTLLSSVPVCTYGAQLCLCNFAKMAAAFSDVIITRLFHRSHLSDVVKEKWLVGRGRLISREIGTVYDESWSPRLYIVRMYVHMKRIFRRRFPLPIFMWNSFAPDGFS